jgi:hypothetical protein
MMNKLAAALFVFAVGCASATETDGAFHVAGRVDDARVTHVVATNPVDGARVIAAVEAGSFELALEPGKQWVVTFADAKKSGADMKVAILQVGGLDALVPQHDGAVDLGLVTIAGRAKAATSTSSIIEALGLDEEMATQFGTNDALALRVASPDVDNDGFIDAVSPLLEVTGRVQIQRNGSALTVSDLITGNYADASVKYVSTTLMAGVPSSMNMAMKTGTVTFEQPFYGTALGTDAPAIMPGTPIGAPHVKFGELDGMHMIGLVARAGYDAPRGTYELGFANGQLTFTDVFPPTAPVVESAQSYSIPFVHIAPRDAACVGNCTIESLSLDWSKLTASGWEKAEKQPAHIDIVLQRAGQKTYLAADTASTVQWSAIDIANTGLVWSELAYFTTKNICYIGVTYESELGMKMTNELYNPDCF